MENEFTASYPCGDTASVVQLKLIEEPTNFVGFPSRAVHRSLSFSHHKAQLRLVP